jgi:hypothetical protein
MTSVIYALSVTPLLSGVVRIAQTNLPVRYYLPQTIWAGTTFAIILLTWWALWGFRDVEWTFSDFLLVVFEPVLLFFASSLLYPQRLDDSEVDLRLHFKKISRMFFAAHFVLLILVTADGVILGIEPVWIINRYFQLFAMSICAWAYIDRRDTSQLITSSTFAIAILVFVSLRWLSAPG